MPHATSTTSAPARSREWPERATDRRQFGLMIYPDAPFPELRRRIRLTEALGFDQLVVPDHIGDLRDLNSPWYEPMTLLTVAAIETETIRIGTLVSNPILRPPALLAKQAIALDHLSGGRLELGIGAGVFEFDHHAVGTERWGARERAERFAEYTAILDGMLRSEGQPFSYEGAWLWVREAPTSPGPLQRPRPPIVAGGQSPSVLRTAARHADVWNTIGPMGAGAEDVLAVTAEQNRLLDQLCREAGRDPATLRRSYATYGPWDPFEAPVSLEEVVDRFSAIGMTEFVLGWPPAGREAELEALARDVIPTLRDL